MQKYGTCELCGKHELVADFGFNGEFICVECGCKDPKLSQHIDDEMVRRHGIEFVKEIIDEALGIAGQVRH